MEAWDICPWCNTFGAPYAVQKDCKYFFKGDCNDICDACGHHHETLDKAKCSGTIDGDPYPSPSCPCTVYVQFLTPCEKFIAGIEASAIIIREVIREELNRG